MLGYVNITLNQIRYEVKPKQTTQTCELRRQGGTGNNHVRSQHGDVARIAPKVQWLQRRPTERPQVCSGTIDLLHITTVDAYMQEQFWLHTACKILKEQQSGIYKSWAPHR